MRNRKKGQNEVCNTTNKYTIIFYNNDYYFVINSTAMKNKLNFIAFISSFSLK